MKPDRRRRAQFPKPARLADAAAFERAFKAGRRGQGVYFAVHRVANGRGGARLGIIVARRTTGTNVRRNHIKRLIREVFRLRHERLSGWDWVVRTKQAPPLSREAEARIELEHLLSLPASPSGERAV
ncbi:MAG: ribonuclease P protein component [Betaproteobacteria bacterium]|nr:ribonuclease P protein component [Rhodocyclaceae bacterium]MCA3133895.1 ribonuclease P protein component [Rhodocyclaceae bacterium]MCA3142019.1 ribonuclease P protein component [Rhodocyclaceae bacterium]MCA3147209.1 ribonuclease P protein component [Rhodocyclaceae bacterium]